MKFKTLFILLIALFSFKLSFSANKKSFENLKLKDINNNEYIFSTNKKGTYIKLWASWCPVCLDGLDELNNIDNKNFDVVTIVFPNKYGEKNNEDFKKWFTSLGYKNIKVLFDEKNEIEKLVKIRAYPTSIILNSKGEIQKVFLGNLSSEPLPLKALSF